MENFEKRLAALEKSNARYRLVIICTLSGLLYFTISSFKPKHFVPDVLQAKKFELLDDRNNVLVRIENFQGAGALTTFKPNGNILTDIVATKSNSGGIVIYGDNGYKNIVLTDMTGGGGSVVVNNGDGAKVVSLGKNTKNAGNVSVTNGTNQIIQLTGDTNNDGTVLTYNQAGTQTARLPN